MKEKLKTAWILVKNVLHLTWLRFTNWVGHFILTRPYLVTYMEIDQKGNAQIDSKIFYLGLIRVDYVLKAIANENETRLISITELPRSSVRTYNSKLAKYIELEALKQIDSLREKPEARTDQDEDPDEVEARELAELENMLFK